ncbi:MAG: hypothetical protein NTY34_03090 [Candidatus Omnitrophica bacterium]|nr:hypothetical protein [Candidatus Omnitrophota bacterium]
MKKAVFIIILLLAAGCILGYFIFKERMSTNLAFNSKVSIVADKIYALRDTAIASGEKFKKIISKGEKTLKNTVHASSGSGGPGGDVELRLKHGGVIRGKLLREADDQYMIDWRGDKFTVKKQDVKSIKNITQRDIEWPYKNDIIVRKINGVICDGKIISLDDKAVTLSFEEGGGGMELGVPRTEINSLIFAPVCNKDTDETEEHIKELFPKMKIYKEGNITLFTDSYVNTAKWCQKITRALYAELYFKFFTLFKDRKPQFQNFIVLFDDPIDYIDSTGMPPYIPGYFDPSERVLYLYNMFGERAEEMLFTMLTSATDAVYKDVEKQKKKLNIDERYDIFIDGRTKEFTDRFWRVKDIYKRSLTDETKSTLRHELTHEIFHNWGLQNIITSKPVVNKEKLIEKRKEFIEATDWEKKKKLLDEMMKMGKPEEIEMAVAESWLAEGLAAYCATEPAGGIDEDLLFTFQDAVSKEGLNPIEFFTGFEKGSFVGIALKSKYNLYAQSWAFTCFLMAKYPSQFVDYQKKIAEKITKEDKKDNLTLLLACLGKNLSDLGKEFDEYMRGYQKAEDPFVKRYIEVYDVWRDLLESHL